MLGIYVSGHPLDRFADKVGDLATHSTDKLEDLEKDTSVRCADCSRAFCARRTAKESIGPR